MKKTLKYLLGIFVIVITLYRCSDTTYTMGDLTAPTDLAITTEIVGATTANPNGDGSGNVKITISANNALAYKVDYDANNAVDLVYLSSGTVTKKYATLGLNTYRITAVAYGKGGTTSTITKDVTVQSNFNVAPEIVTNLTGGTSKTWAVDASLPGQIGVGPWEGSAVPEWWAAAVNEKVACCNCFYTSTFKFSKDAATGAYSLQVTNPDGAFTKTGSLTTLPGIPASGDEGCYSYNGGTSSFSFVPSSTGIAATTPSTQTSILLAGNDTYIGYGAVQKEYEILVLTETYMYLRVQGTETGNAWYLKLKAL
ncbi:MAG TPA: hypothetical protein VFC67_28125 [Prolixibacteraceae bacterium]|nr:hypothetical protein [Prolixibacteraceae bacterium]